MIFPSYVDASVRFYHERRPIPDDGDSADGKTCPEEGVLIESDPKAVRRVMDTRMEVLEEEKRKAEGKEPEKRNFLRKLKWWLNRRNRQTARDNMWDYSITTLCRFVLLSHHFNFLKRFLFSGSFPPPLSLIHI